MRASTKQLVPAVALLLGATAVFGIKAVSDSNLEENTVTSTAAAEDEPEEEEVPSPEAAAAAAKAFLAIIDSEKYQDSWLEAASELQSSVPAEKWEATLKSVRQPLGKLVSRKVRSNETAPVPTGGKCTEYRTLIYDSSFESKKAGAETIVLGLDRFGTWKMTSYLVK